MSVTSARVRPSVELRPAAGVAAILVLVASGTAVAFAAVAAPHFSSRIHGLPGWTGGALGGASLGLTAAQLYVLLGAMGIAYLGVLALRPPLHWVVAAVVALHAVFLLGPPLFSTDIFSYLSYGRLGALHGLDPYVATPSARPHDVVYPFVHWRTTPSAYGPLFTVASYGFAQLSPAAGLVAFKALAALSSLGCAGLIGWIARRLGRAPAPAVAAFGLNPLVLTWTVGGAHNDVTMLLLTLAGIALVLGAREVAGGAALVAAVAVKASAGLAIPFVVLGARRRRRTALGVAAGALVVGAISFVAFSDHAAGMVQVLSAERSLVSADSVPTDVAFLFGGYDVTTPVRVAFELGFVAAVALALFQAWRRRDVITPTGWAFLALVATSTWLLGWYTIWSLPFAALSRDRRLLIATIAVQAYFLVNHMPAL
jgi:alpha-1,6-mannosyltransferase